MTKHALLSASSAKRWLNCPPSARMCEGIDGKTSVFAEEGTLAHELAALKLERIRNPGLDEDVEKAFEKARKSELYDPEMEDFTDRYAEYVDPAGADWVGIEKRVDFSNVVPEGFGTADCIAVRGEELNVYDLKYGRGVRVEAPYNPQLMLYAVGACNLLPVEDMDVRRLRLHIIQPRLDNVSVFSLTLRELGDFADEVRKIAPAAYEGKGEPKAGDWCRFCPAKGACRASRDLAVKAAEKIHGNLNCMTPAELGNLLDVLDDLEEIRAAAREQAVRLILDGGAVQGYKVVAGRSARKFRDETEALERIQRATGENLYEVRPLSLAKIEKLLGKRRFNEVAGDCVYTPPGSPTLAKSDDPRKEYRGAESAEEIFKNMDIQEVLSNE